MSSQLKICHVITRMIIGGAQENTLYTCQGHLERGHKVTLVTGPSEGAEGSLLKQTCPPGLEIIEIPSLCRNLNPLQDWKAYKELRQLFQTRYFDVVHTHSSKAGILGRLAAWKASVPLVVHTVHGQPFFPYQFFLKNWFYIAAERYAAKHCDKIFAVAQAMIDQCVRAKVAPRSKYKVVYSGMDLEAFIEAQPEPELMQQLGITEKNLVVGKIARLFDLKGHDVLLEAAPKIIASVPEVKFLLVGDGPLRAKIEKKAADLKITDHIIFAGLVPPAEVCRYTALMHVLAHLSLREGLPRTAVQALASGVPVVAYPLDGTPEVVINGLSGYLCEPKQPDKVADAVIRLLRNPKRRVKMGEYGRQEVQKKFSWRLMSNILEIEYIEGLERKKAATDSSLEPVNKTVRTNR
ncbi:MAG: glycosyltransferase family 4 protein [Lentisphaerae bacterium]|jgi:glycosyltransferase involved in cell wall biosynthesis|nr:glycosyltransferase family 4 protein [Lentisphaerota bacterium]